VTFLRENIASRERSSTDAKRDKSKVNKGHEATPTATDKQKQVQYQAVDYGSLFEHRFPKSHWKDAVSFFTES
jgi:2-keto-4-pentenoate hydratase